MKFLIQSLFCFITATGLIYAGGRDSGGGDFISLQFVRKELQTHAELSERFPKGMKQIDLDQFRAFIKETKVELSSDENEFLMDGARKHARYYRQQKLIHLYEPVWTKITDPNQVQVLGFHEYLGILGDDDSNYQISSLLIAGHISDRRQMGAKIERIEQQAGIILAETGYAGDGKSFQFWRKKVDSLCYDMGELEQTIEIAVNYMFDRTTSIFSGNENESGREISALSDLKYSYKPLKTFCGQNRFEVTDADKLKRGDYKTLGIKIQQIEKQAAEIRERMGFQKGIALDVTAEIFKTSADKFIEELRERYPEK
jgi:hypothetical protein